MLSELLFNHPFKEASNLTPKKSHPNSIQTTCKLFNFLTDSPDLIGELCPLRLVGDVVGEDGAAESEDEDGLRLEGVSQG